MKLLCFFLKSPSLEAGQFLFDEVRELEET